MNRDELALMSERLMKERRVFNHRFTHLRGFVKSHVKEERTPKMLQTRGRSRKQTISLLKCVFVAAETKGIVQLLPWRQMASLFLNCVSFFNLLGEQDRWCLRHLEHLYIIRKVAITEIYCKALFALDIHDCIINKLPSNLHVFLNTFAQDNEICCPENILFSCFMFFLSKNFDIYLFLCVSPGGGAVSVAWRKT